MNLLCNFLNLLIYRKKEKERTSFGMDFGKFCQLVVECNGFNDEFYRNNQIQGLQGGGYLRRLLFEKIPTIVKWCVFTVLVTCLYWVIIGNPPNKSEILFCFTGNRLLNWFFASIIIKYLLFVIVAFISKDRYISLICNMFVLTSIDIMVCRALNMAASWYCSSLAFPIGVLLCYMMQNSSQTKDISYWPNRHQYEYLFVLGLLFVLTYTGVYIKSDLLVMKCIRLMSQIISAVMFALFVFVLCIGRKSNRILLYCGRYSGQMIFVQNFSLTLLHNNRLYVENDLLYAFLTIIIQVVLLIIMVPVYEKIRAWKPLE